ncbi:MAG: 50S ribosomal protein L18 [Candidatus Thermoplasmatota archaeon]|nr:50S ribosomal protein L18 [Candidatus Thermoplasmatota archaeon]
MSQGPRYQMKLRRRREGITNYRHRLALLKSGEPRIVVRRSIKNIRVQFIDYAEQGDRVLISALGSELKKDYQWKHSCSSTPAAYLTGLLAGTRAKKNGIKSGVLDIGRQVPVNGSKVFAVLKGILDAGISCPHGEGIFPDENRIHGKHIDDTIEKDVTNIKKKIIGGDSE